VPEYAYDSNPADGPWTNGGAGDGAVSNDPLWLHRTIVKERFDAAQRIQANLTVAIVPR
jgi:hypothetical protein